MDSGGILKNLPVDEPGLSKEEANRRLLIYGPNEITSRNKKSALYHFLKKFFNPLIITLIFVAIISLAFGEQINAWIIIAMAILSVVLSFIQEHNASRAAEKLRSMVKITARVYRDGQLVELSIREIVPGDEIELTAGKMVPADVKITKSNDLYINQATLTGESFPVKKIAQESSVDFPSSCENPNLAFMGSSVASGLGEAIVLKTGASTEFGKLSKETAQVANETAFQKGINRFTWLMIRFTFLLIFFIFVVNAVFKGNIIEALLFSLAIAIGLTPEMLPMIVTINLAKGAIDMARKKVIIKELASIQNFGAMNVLCADKTGTLTINDIVLIKHCDVDGKENDKILRLAFLNSRYQSGLDNLLDNAVLKHKTFDLAGIKKIDELPFDFNRRIMSVIIEENGVLKLISKGAPEEIFKRSKNYLIDEKIFALDEKMKKRLEKRYEQFSQDGFRVLAIASREIGNQEDYTDNDEEELTFAGFVAFLDPPKPTAANAVRQMNSLGIKFKILSGDNELICRKICSELNIPIDGVLGGEEIDKLSDFDLEQKIEKTNIFSRLNPFQKERVIKALKQKGYTVGYLGDGINDAPSLKAADVGISVSNATDIAKETAQIILLEKSLTVLADCVAEGRKTFANVIKYIKMGSSSNFGNMISMAGASLFLPFLPMLPPQILLNNFLYDVSQVALPTDEVDKEYLGKPKPWNINFIKEFMIYIGPISSIFDFATFGIMWYIFHATPELFHTGWFVESLATQVFVVYIIRTAKIPFLESRPSNTFLVVTLSIVILAAILPYTFLGRLMGFVPLPLLFFIILMALVISYLVLVQFVKQWFIKKFGYE